jgi:hypothetical protein
LYQNTNALVSWCKSNAFVNNNVLWREMKKFIIPTLLTLVLLVLGWCGGNIWADRVRETKAVGFDIGTRLMYQSKGIGAGALAAVILVPVLVAWLRAREKQRKTTEPEAGGYRR